MSQRLKAVPCVGGCGKTTLLMTALCGTCAADVRDGRRLRQAKPGEKLSVFHLVSDLTIYPWPDGHRKVSEYSVASKRLAAALHATLVALGGTRLDDEARHTWNVVKIAPRHGQSLDRQSYSYRFVLAGNPQAALQELLEALEDVATSAWADGYEDGESMLVRIARGDLTIGEVNDVIAAHERLLAGKGR